MGRQSRLVLLLLFSLALSQVTSSTTPHDSVNIVRDDPKDNEIDDSQEEPLLPIRKNGTPKVKDDLKKLMESANAKKAALASTLKPVSDEVLKDLIEASKHSPVLADDPRFNKMLPDKLKVEDSTKTSNKSDEYYYDYNSDDYDDDYDSYDETTSTKSAKLATTTTSKPISETSKIEKPKSIEMKPIKEEKKKTSIPTNAHKAEIELENNETNKIDEKHNVDDNDDDYKEEDDDIDSSDDDDDDDDEDDDDDDDDDFADEDVIFKKDETCPRYCVCTRNLGRFLVATCSRFDPGTQKFGSEITDLVVSDVGPKYPILLGPEFFAQMGLKHVSSIKISNCTIEYVHATAFHGLDELYSVNLTNVGLAIFSPDTFAKNKKLRLLTISGNELSVLSSLHYILNSSTVEELVLSNNNLIELNPNAFSQLPNIVYINLSNNNLKKIPENIFDTVEALEELDLSSNSLTTLPTSLFNRTSLAILHLRYNSFTHDLHFANSELQQLDLSYNAIKYVHHGMFDKLTGLTNLNLRGNVITKISPDSFLALKNLRHIDLSVNDLDQISSMLFYKNSDLDVIRLNDNPRLKYLPTDGFLCSNGYFPVYFLDISNCAIGALGHKTFSTMPNLASLKLSWNNINNLDPDTFAALTKLNDLDLSNNLITRLDDDLFINNNEITKLNLSGNTVRRLSTHLLMPLHKLRELDLSDCELASLLTDIDEESNLQKYKFFDTLRSFNASANQIKDLSSADVKYFKNLHTLDITRNPLKCNEHFQDFISYVSLNKIISPNTNAIVSQMVKDASTNMEGVEGHREWAKIAMEICKHQDGLNFKTKTIDIVTEEHKEELEKRLEDADKEMEEDDLYLLSMMEKRKSEEARRILKGKKKTEKTKWPKPTESDDIVKDADEEENESDYDDDDDDDADDDYYEEEDEYDTKKQKSNGKNSNDKIINHGVKVEEIDLRAETKDKFLLNKFLLNGDDKSTVEDKYEDEDDDDDDDDEEIIIERGRIYYSGYKFLIPIIIILSGVLALLLVIAKIISMVMRKRGERYRMALLAASKNSIVYQKLTEDIAAPLKESKHPKVHRYAPINQV